MKTLRNSQSKGVTLIELSLVIGIILILIGTTTTGLSMYKKWQKGLAAGEDLKAVYQAQKLFLADNPTTLVANITAANITPYLPNGMAAIPQITGLDGTARNIVITTSPPTISGGYDPSSSNDDSLWDTGR